MRKLFLEIRYILNKNLISFNYKLDVQRSDISRA